MAVTKLALHAGSTDADAIRTETFRGREYTVVPVIALVEGIIQGLNAKNAEFASADEFAKFPVTWNGRPVTLDHPRNNGQLVSANSTEMLEAYQIGFLANTTRDGNKLKTEAWIDEELASALGDDATEMMDRIKAGEEFVEVSTGLFTDVVNQTGFHNNTAYKLAWEGVVPDHLAFLPNTVGACSVANGCGAPRLNSKGELVGVVASTPLNLGAPPKPCCETCAQGDPCMGQEASTTPKSQEGTDSGTPATSTAATPTPEAPADGTTESPEAPTTASAGEESGESEELVEALEVNAAKAESFDRLVANAVPSGMTFENIRAIVSEALRLTYGNNGGMSDCGCYRYHYFYISAITTDQVAWERYVRGTETYETVAVNYSIDENGGVTFTGEPVPVNLIVTITPKPQSDSGVTVNEGVNEGSSGANQQQEEGPMADSTNGGEGGNTAATTDTSQTGAQQAGGESRANGAVEAPAPRTLEQYLTEAPSDVREILEESIAMRQNQRDTLVKDIVTNSKGLFTAEELATKSFAELSKIHTLSAPKADFTGRAIPNGQTEGVTANSQRDNGGVPPAPKAFEGRKITDTKASLDSSAAAA